jgi:hypothetical protein
MPKEGETCVNCGHEIRRTVAHVGTLDGVTRTGEGWACGPHCNAPTGPSDVEATED